MTSSGRIVGIVNPRSGVGRGVRVAAELKATLETAGVPHDVILTERGGHAESLAFEAVQSGATIVAAVGGDGTIHEVANGLLRARVAEPDKLAALGVVPVGTGNDFAKVVPGVTPTENAIRTLVTGTVRRFDAGLATWDGGSRYFVNAAGTGIDVEVVRVMGPERSGSVYFKALLKALRRFRAIPLRLVADGAATVERVMMIAVANGRCIGGSFRISPRAEPYDGQLDLCVVSELSMARSVVVAARIVLGRHERHPAVRALRVRSLELTVAEGTPLFFQLDGELLEPETARALRIEVCPGMLPVQCATAK